MISIEYSEIRPLLIKYPYYFIEGENRYIVTVPCSMFVVSIDKGEGSIDKEDFEINFKQNGNQ